MEEKKDDLKIIVRGQPIPAKRVTGRTLWKAKAYADYKEFLAWQIKLQLRPKFPITEDITLKRVWFYRENNRRADIDNLLKCVMEAIALSGYIANDKQVTRVLDMGMEYKSLDPRVEIDL